MRIGVNIWSRELMPIGKLALLRGGHVVWIGPIGSPIEDAEFDTVVMNPADVERTNIAADKFNRRHDIIRALLKQ